MQENPFEKLDSSHEHIPPSSENTEQHLAQNALCDIRNSDSPKLSILLILMKWQNMKKTCYKIA